ncbi:hypothetical protein ILUMI_11204 [Ignelater luminosus]|uniref:Uncharacterized protein n=1 Tax=Ignelater luminosus TaxID=2038154 RepID=A0A8K0D0N4_IGNLU|nr:hypothetical protein ILUMI_11204 [Ignelater luminosus]
MAVSDAIYNSDWYLQDYSVIRAPIPLIIQKSQQSITFLAGGLFQINARTILTVLRVSWSACTLMRALRK